MNAAALQVNDVFVDCSEEEWKSMSNRDRKRAHRTRVIKALGYCNPPNRIHFKTTAGDWCIPADAPVTLVTAVERVERKAA